MIVIKFSSVDHVVRYGKTQNFLPKNFLGDLSLYVGVSFSYFYYYYYCACVKRITLCNCLSSSSPSSCNFARAIRNIGKFGAKNCFTDEQLIQYTVLEIQFRSLKYMAVIRIHNNLSNFPFFSETHHFTDHAKNNWENPFCNIRTLW